MGQILTLPNIVLGSASPARKMVLRNAGIDPEVIVSHLDEDALVAARGWTSPEDIAGGLAVAKTESVADLIVSQNRPTPQLIIGCDSVMEFAGHIHGKPGTAENARARLREMSGGRGTLHTGHHVIFLHGEKTTTASAVTSTDVVFHEISDAEVNAYVATGEPLNVAGAYTLDSLGGPFIREIHGDPSNVIGISLPTLRQLFAELEIGWDLVLRQSPK